MDKRDIVLYGAGKYGKSVAEKLKMLKIPILSFCDADLLKAGKTVSGITVKRIDEVKSQYKKGEYGIFVSISPINAAAVKRELIASGVFDPSDFLQIEDRLEYFIFDRLAHPPTHTRAPRAADCHSHYVDAARRGFVYLDDEGQLAWKDILIAARYSDDEYRRSEVGQRDFDDHFSKRQNNFREKTIPWLSSIHSLRDATVLEIGCGTGSLTVALCEQGASVTAIDLDEQGMELAEKRLKLHGLGAYIISLNATEIKSRFGGGFDFVIFSASLEHMTYSERILSIKAAYDMLSDEQYMILVEIPNRLHHTDVHTSREPFFNWLPSELAMDYAPFTSREGFNEGFDRNNPDDQLRFCRKGRGVSYHEFEVAVGISKLEVISSMRDFFRLADDPYKTLLKIHGPPRIDAGFYDPYLDLALAKAGY